MYITNDLMFYRKNVKNLIVILVTEYFTSGWYKSAISKLEGLVKLFLLCLYVYCSRDAVMMLSAIIDLEGVEQWRKHHKLPAYYVSIILSIMGT